MLNTKDSDFERLVLLEARMQKKTQKEVLQQIQENIPVDQLKCDSQSDSPVPKLTSRQQSPNSQKAKSKHDSSKKKNQIDTPPVKKKKTGDGNKITHYLHEAATKKQIKKQLKFADKLHKNSAEYSIQDSPKRAVSDDINSDKLLKEKMNQLAIAQAQIQGQNELNTQLREELNEVNEKQTRCIEALKRTVIEKEILKRSQLRIEYNQNRLKLGEFIMQRDKTAMNEVWVDGSLFKSLKEQLKLIESQKQELENKRKLTKVQVDVELFKNSLALKAALIQKEEQSLNEQMEHAEIEKSLFIKELKRQFEEEHARFTKQNEWPIVGDRYQILSLLGRGGFSEVYKAYDLIEFREVACKIHQLNPNWSDHSKNNYIKHAVRENRVHKELNHPNIVKLFDSVEIDKTSFCTVLELCDGVDLSFYLKRYKQFSEKDTKMMIIQLLSAIKYLNTYKNKIIHYDLKPQNILFHQNEVKVSDFGLCKIVEDDHSKLMLTSQGVGTYWYLPPECFLVGDQPPNISSKVDIWSIGVIMFEMLFGQKPFGQGISQEKILKEQIILKSQQVVFPPKPSVSNECKEFLRACLAHNQQDRLDVIQACQHPYIMKKQ